VIGDSRNRVDKFPMWLEGLIMETFLIVINSPRRDEIRKFRAFALTFFSSTSTMEESKGQWELLRHQNKVSNENSLPNWFPNRFSLIQDRYRKIGGAARWLFSIDQVFEIRFAELKKECREITFKNNVEFVLANELTIDEYSHTVIDIKGKKTDSFTKYDVSWRPYPHSLLEESAKKITILATRKYSNNYYKNGNQHGMAGFKFEQLFGQLLMSYDMELKMLNKDHQLGEFGVVNLPKNQQGNAKDVAWWPIENTTLDANYRSINFPCIDFATFHKQANGCMLSMLLFRCQHTKVLEV